jgi:Fe-S-cluster containining protein
MKLDVIQSPDRPWYADGLNFTCQQCGNCCTGGPGYVWVSDVELDRLADYLKLTREDVIQKYCRRVGGRYSLKEIRRGQLYDCVFLTESKASAGNGDRVVHSTRGCSIYPVRPLQCRTWPFWPGNLSSKNAWERAGKGCHGINHGRKFTIEKIVELRDAKDWPENPPTSGT